MAIRSYITAGAAFATAGMVALVPAIAPPLAPRDIQVVKQTEAQVNMAALSLTDLINTYFGVDPQNGVPVTDAPGTSGVAGVIYQLLMEQQGSYVPGRVTLTQYFNGGLAALAQLYLVANNADPAQQEGINTFFNGGLAELVRLYLVSNNTDPDQVAGINAFFDGGVTQLAYEYLASGAPDEDSLDYLNRYFSQGEYAEAGPGETGATGVIYKRLRDGFTDPVQQANIDAFFTGGVTEVSRLQLLAGFQDPEQQGVINDFYDGGVTQVSRTQILSRLPAGSPQADLVNEFYDNGISGVVRYLLVGPAPEPPPAPPMMKTAALSAPADVVEKKADEPAAPKVEALSAPAPAADPAPASDPAPAGDPAPKFTAKIREVPKDEEEPTDGGANKAEPEILLESTKGPKPGEGSWGIFQGVADALGGLGTKPAAPSAPSGGTDAGDGGGEG